MMLDNFQLSELRSDIANRQSVRSEVDVQTGSVKQESTSCLPQNPHVRNFELSARWAARAPTRMYESVRVLSTADFSNAGGIRLPIMLKRSVVDEVGQSAD
jgi:hypothetical protein